MRLYRIILVTALACGLAGAALAAPVLKVNAVDITQGQLAIAKYKVAAERPSIANDDAAVTKAAVDLLVTDALLAEAAREKGIAISEKDVKKAIASLQARLGGKAIYADTLKKLFASEEELKDVGVRRMLARRYVESVIAPSVTVNAEEARAYYQKPENQIYHPEQRRIRAIFVNAPPSAGEKEVGKARARIDEAARRILAGEDFRDVARGVSDDMSKANGGDIGWVGRSIFPAHVADAVWAVEPGDMTEVLRGEFAFGLVQVVEKRAAGTFPFEEMEEQATESLQRSKTDAAVASFVAGRRSTAKIEGVTPETAAALQR